MQCHTKQVVGRRLVAMSHKTSRRPTTCCNVTQNKSSGDDLLQCHTKQVVAQALIAMSPKKKSLGDNLLQFHTKQVFLQRLVVSESVSWLLFRAN